MHVLPRAWAPSPCTLRRPVFHAFPALACLQELAARKIVKSVGGEVLQLSKVAAAAGGAGAAAAATPPAQPAAATAQLDAVAAPLSAGPTPVAAGSFLACVSRYAGKAGAAAGMAQMDDTWATNQATTFLVSGGLERERPTGCLPASGCPLAGSWFPLEACIALRSSLVCLAQGSPNTLPPLPTSAPLGQATSPQPTASHSPCISSPQTQVGGRVGGCVPAATTRLAAP